MPRWACRIGLEIVGIGVEKLHDITYDDARAEGIFLNHNEWWKSGNGLRGEPSPQAAYRALWATINGEESWNSNPWVWVIEFRVIQNV
jgi:hypothetical protein